MKAEIRGRQKQGLSEDEKRASKASERGGNDDSPYQAIGRAPPSWKNWYLSLNILCLRVKIAQAGRKWNQVSDSPRPASRPGVGIAIRVFRAR